MDPQYYKLIHLVGIMMIYLGFGALVARGMSSSDHIGIRKFGGIISGIGLLLVFLGGIGMWHKSGGVINITDWWLLVKFGVLAVFGVLTSVAIRKPECSTAVWIILIVLGAVAAYLGLFGRTL